jgi:hypothetical protein
MVIKHNIKGNEDILKKINEKVNAEERKRKNKKRVE